METGGKRILILGAGIGGLTAAIQLRKGLPANHHVVLVDRAKEFVFQGSLPWVLNGKRTPDQISRPYSHLKAAGVEFVNAAITRVDCQQKCVTLANGSVLTGDFLVIALGAELRPELIPGLKEAGHNAYSLKGAKAIEKARFLDHGRVAVVVADLPYRCPAAPLEIAMLLQHDFLQRSVHNHVQVDLYTPEPGPMPVAGEGVSQQVRAMVESRGIRYHPGHAVVKVDAQQKVIHFANGVEAPFDLLIYIPPHRLPGCLQDSGLALTDLVKGWVLVNPVTLETSLPGVFAIGDVNMITLKAVGKPLPKAAVFASAQAEVVASRIVHAITGEGKEEDFKGIGMCMFEIGGGLAAKGYGNFFAGHGPDIMLEGPSSSVHEDKIQYEQFWLSIFESKE